MWRMKHIRYLPNSTRVEPRTGELWILQHGAIVIPKTMALFACSCRPPTSPDLDYRDHLGFARKRFAQNERALSQWEMNFRIGGSQNPRLSRCEEMERAGPKIGSVGDAVQSTF